MKEVLICEISIIILLCWKLEAVESVQQKNYKIYLQKTLNIFFDKSFPLQLFKRIFRQSWCRATR